jgi:hypothetical protein
MIRTMLIASLLVTAAGAAHARDGSDKPRHDRHPFQRNVFVVPLDSYQEVPTLVTKGAGTTTLRIQGQTIRYTLSYARTDSTVTQAHIHIGRAAINGGISAFLCTNLGNGPSGTPRCPASGKVSGTIRQATGPTAQGVDNIAELIQAIRAGAVYINVHTQKFPGGEIRGNVGHSRHH